MSTPESPIQESEAVQVGLERCWACGSVALSSIPIQIVGGELDLSSSPRPRQWESRVNAANSADSLIAIFEAAVHDFDLAAAALSEKDRGVVVGYAEEPRGTHLVGIYPSSR